MTDSRTSLIYPAPTIVIGVGKLGLATLERLAEDWQRLKVASDDPSVRNLRLMHVRPGQDAGGRGWRDAERHFVAIARYTGDGDMPSLALDFVILRSLGLIRYRDGIYQVAEPRDAGLVEKNGAGRVVRRRFFDWISLHPDPIASIERLESACQQRTALGLFVRPLLNRVRQGHSPRAALSCISRVRALSQGRDPSPWSWFARALAQSRETESQDAQHVMFRPSWVTRDDLRGLLEGFAPEPVLGWSDWFRRTHHDWVHDPDPHDVPFASSGIFDITLPAPFIPQARDLPSPLIPQQLLRVDWENNGWATDIKDALGEVEFTPVDASPYRLGLFDHDSSSRVHGTTHESFTERLRELSVLAHRGLVRLWVDLQRNRVEDQNFDISDTRRKVGVDETLSQSLEILGELLVRPLLEESEDTPAVEHFPGAREDLWSKNSELAESPSEFLRGLEVERRGEDNEVRSALTRRLLELGLTSSEADLSGNPLMRSVEIAPEDLYDLDVHGPRPQKVGSDALPHGLLQFRRMLNEETRQLFDFSFLSRYRYRPTRRPPRLTVYVVGDVGEPFVRTSIRSLMREIHAELLRAYSPIFESFREGFDRSLCILPILWMPHPADAFGGLHPAENRCEEAAIIESIQGIRRWVETVPRGTRCIPQVIINSLVTDNAVLSKRDAVSQTRDFMTFQIRNDLSRDAWLRKTVVGPGGDDFFASFACHEVEFPAERAREYLANRFARDMISQIKRGDPGELPAIDEEPLLPPDVPKLLREPTGRTRKQTRRAAETTGQLVEDRVALSATTSAGELIAAFNEDFEEEMLRQIHAQWRALTRARGEMDGMMDGLRRETSEHLGKTLKVVRKSGDALIDTHASRGGLKAAQAGFHQLESLTRDNLMGCEESRQRAEALCARHRIPQTSPIATERAALVEAAATKPDHRAMRFGLLIWALIAPGIAAPLLYTLARATQVYKDPGVAEFILGPLGPLVGALLFFLPVWWLLRNHMRKIVEKLRIRINDFAQTAREVVEGTGTSFGGSPSIRSFIEARLNMTAALNTRNFALRVHERVVQDADLAHRLSRSIDIQQDVLLRRAEDLGVRARLASGASDEEGDDVSRLFTTRDGQLLDFLVQPLQLQSYYLRHYGEEKERQAMVPEFIDEVGGFSEWRKHACMSDTERLMRHARGLFEEVVAKPVAEQYTFEEDVGESLQKFVAAHYSNMGFGAKFMGYEGLDPDGVQILCDTTLVIHPALRRTFEEARRKPGARPFTETLDIVETSIIPNAAYMLSFAQGIRPHSLRNLMRFESYHDRVQLPDDRIFPMSGEEHALHDDHARPINHLTGFEDLSRSLNTRVFELSRQRGHIASAEHALPIPGGLLGESISEHRDRSDRPMDVVDLRHVVPLSELSPEQLAGIPEAL